MVLIMAIEKADRRQMQSWNAVRLGLMALGYRRVLTVEIVCIAHGTFRGAMEEEQDFYNFGFA